MTNFYLEPSESSESNGSITLRVSRDVTDNARLRNRYDWI